MIEKTTEPLARDITRQTEPPIIGIETSAGRDGQILVVDAMIGLFTEFRRNSIRRHELAAELQAAQPGNAPPPRIDGDRSAVDVPINPMQPALE